MIDKKTCIFIFGLGVSGLGAFNFLKQNKNLDVFCSDDSNHFDSPFFVKNYLEFDFSNVDYLMVSPSIPILFPEAHKIVSLANSFGVKIVSDLELFHILYGSGKKFIGITGTNGKSTTTSLVFHILKNCGFRAALCGNIGISPFDYANHLDDFDYFVCEVSSYQLETTHFCFDFALLLNITEDHLYRHGGMDGYIKTKMKILQNCKVGFANCDDFVVSKQQIPLCVKTFAISDYEILPRFENLIGRHNMYNIFGAFLIAKEIGISYKDFVYSVSIFKNLPHRIEFVCKKNDISFFNDSKATNADSAKIALNAMIDAGFDDIFLIAGGMQKEVGIEGLFNEDCFKKVRNVFLIGQAAGVFAKSIIEYNSQISNGYCKIHYVLCGNIENAIEKSFLIAKKSSYKNRAVLFSPLCASFDQFKNFEHRGEVFCDLVLKLS